MRFTSPVHPKHARIEIIPLIDVMFFLLASFMMVSLNMTRIENIQVNVPAATQVQADFPPDMVHIAVDRDGGMWVEKASITPPDLFTTLTNRFQINPKVPVYIAGDGEARHGDMVKVLELVRKAGIQKVSFTANSEATPNVKQSS